MSADQDRIYQRTDGPGQVEQMAALGTRVRRRKESSRRKKEHHAGNPGIEETLQDEQDLMQNTSDSSGNEHIDFHA